MTNPNSTPPTPLELETALVNLILDDQTIQSLFEDLVRIFVKSFTLGHESWTKQQCYNEVNRWTKRFDFTAKEVFNALRYQQRS